MRLGRVGGQASKLGTVSGVLVGREDFLRGSWDLGSGDVREYHQTDPEFEEPYPGTQDRR